jgi:glycosyltransferase involved in cell wall biosynthesis
VTSPGNRERRGPALHELPGADFGRPLRIAQVAPVAQSVPPVKSGSIETTTNLLVDGLVSRGHDVTLFATGSSNTKARLHAIFDRGYCEDTSMWPWELCELFNLAAAVEQGADFDVIHYQAEYSPMSLAFTRLSATPVLQTLHHSPTAPEIALWSRYRDAPFVAVSHDQARALAGLNVLAVIPHAIDTAAYPFRSTPDDYLLFLGRFSEGKGVLQAIEVARRTGSRLLLAAAENEYYCEVVAPLVDQMQIVYAGEVGHREKTALLGGARALLYPVQSGEPFGLVMAEAMVCGTPVAALDRGAVREVVDEGTTGCVFDSLDALVEGLPSVFALDRALVRARALERFDADRMVAAYLGVYARLAASRLRHATQEGRR